MGGCPAADFEPTMSKPVRIERDAEVDILEIFVWYEEQGLGTQFISAFDACRSDTGSSHILHNGKQVDTSRTA